MTNNRKTLSSVCHRVAFLIVLTGCEFAVGQDPVGSTLTEAEALWVQHDIAGADAAFAAIAETSSGRDRAAALRWRGLLAWRYMHEYERGENLFREALSVGVETSETWRELSRLEQDRARFEYAWEAANQATHSAQTLNNRLAGVIQRAWVAAAHAEIGLDTANAAPLANAVRQRLAEAHSALMPEVRANPGDLKIAGAALRTGALLGDGPATLEAWRSYYVLIVEGGDLGILREAHDALSSVLPTWAPESVNPERLASVIIALGTSGFHREAFLLAQATAASVGDDGYLSRVASPKKERVHELLAYAEYAERARNLTDEFYSRTALGQATNGDVRKYRSQFVELARPLWEVLAEPGDVPELSQNSLKSMLDERFGAELTFGRTAGYQDVHWGHRVIHDRINVRQYGHTADLEFVSLDGMVSNGFQTWAWDNRSAHGGWARANGVTQVRTGYAGGSRVIWRAIQDSLELERFKTQMRSESIGDWERAASDPHAFLPGLARRLQLQGVTKLLADLDATDEADADRERRFLAAFDNATFQSSIVAHEGRHSIDKRMRAGFSSQEMEFRAKLSEVAFAPHPRLALGGIFSANIGDATAHGQANLRVVRGLVSWMEAHAGEIARFDSTRPTLPQLDLLTDAQLRTAFASMDPLAG